MEEKEFTEEESGIIKEIKRCIKRFEKLHEILQQPWRKAAEESTQDYIKILNDLIRKVENGELTNEQAEGALGLAEALAASTEVELEHQDFQKSQGEEITPLGELVIGSEK